MIQGYVSTFSAHGVILWVLVLVAVCSVIRLSGNCYKFATSLATSKCLEESESIGVRSVVLSEWNQQSAKIFSVTPL
jgi:hypothetical protein